jgi:hypothetical protein
MGFDLYISCRINVCNETGKLFFYTDQYIKNYSIPPILVPEEYRRFLKQRGHHLGLYTSKVTDEYSTSVENFLDKFPEWSEISEDADYEEYEDIWKEEDHDLFKNALDWLARQEIGFIVSWDF